MEITIFERKSLYFFGGEGPDGREAFLNLYN